MMSFKLNIFPKMLKFRKVTLANLKLGNLSLFEQQFSGVFVNTFDSKSRQFEIKVVFFFKGFIMQRWRGEKMTPM